MEIKYFRDALVNGTDQRAPSTIQSDSCELYLFVFRGTRTEHCERQFIMRGRFILGYCFIRHKRMENKQKSNKCRLLLLLISLLMPGAFVCDLPLQRVIAEKTSEKGQELGSFWT